MKEKQEYSTVVQTNAVSINFNILCVANPVRYGVVTKLRIWKYHGIKWKTLKIKEELVKGGMEAERFRMENNEDKIKNCLCIALWLSQKLELRNLLQTEITCNFRLAAPRAHSVCLFPALQAKPPISTSIIWCNLKTK